LEAFEAGALQARVHDSRRDHVHKREGKEKNWLRGGFKQPFLATGFNKKKENL
jgi:hypothetical protein